MPFAGIAVNTNWADGQPEAWCERFLDVYTKSVAWFYDAKNRDEAVQHDDRR